MSAIITSLNHIGFEVPDLDEARQFFVEALGFRVLENDELRAEPILTVWHELDPGYSSIECLAHNSGLRITLADQQDIYQKLQKWNPKQPAGWRYHLAMNVADLKAMLDSLREYPGVHIKGISMSSVSPYASIITPWGMYILLVEQRSPAIMTPKKA